ncbi:MAG: hypothetical protein ACRDGK_10550, partial [Actinomycetota bacterium]
MLTARRLLDARWLAYAPRLVLAALGLAIVVAAGTSTVAEPSPDTALILLGAVAGVVLLILAYVRFEAFLLTVLAIRATVDWTKVPSEMGQPTRSGTMTTALALVFLGAAVLWLLVQFKTGRLVPPSLLSIAWLAFVGVALVSAVAADRRVESLAEWGRIATVVGMLLVLQQMLGQGVDVRRVLVACYASAVVPLALAAYQGLTGGIASTAGQARVHGTFSHPNAFGFYLVILLVMGVALLPHVGFNARPLLLALLWTSSLALIATYSRGSWVALIVGLVVVAALQDPRGILLVLGATALVALSVP